MEASDPPVLSNVRALSSVNSRFNIILGEFAESIMGPGPVVGDVPAIPAGQILASLLARRALMFEHAEITFTYMKKDNWNLAESLLSQGIHGLETAEELDAAVARFQSSNEQQQRVHQAEKKEEQSQKTAETKALVEGFATAVGLSNPKGGATATGRGKGKKGGGGHYDASLRSSSQPRSLARADSAAPLLPIAGSSAPQGDGTP
jgi:hypothetical protein